MQVGADVHTDSLYVIYFYFPHLGTDECAKPQNKHVFTVYRKSESTQQTLDDIWNVLLWDLQALSQGRVPKAGEEHNILENQELGDYIFGSWGIHYKACVMQFKGDWAYYVRTSLQGVKICTMLIFLGPHPNFV